MPRDHFDFSHQFIHPTNLTIEDDIIPHLPNHPNNRIPNDLSPFPQLFRTHSTRPTNNMDKQIGRSNKIEFYPNHNPPPNLITHITTKEQMSNQFILQPTKKHTA